MAVIYQITNMVNGKYYIGSAESFERRSWQHKSDMKRGVHKNPRLQAAWNNYGPEAFVFEVMEQVPVGANPLEWENKFLHVHVGLPLCYNINIDATAPRLGAKHSEETKARIRANRTAPTGADHYRYGQIVSPETRAKIGNTQRGVEKPAGRTISAEGMAKIRASAAAGNYASFKGKHHSEATKALMSKPIYAVLPNRSAKTFKSLTEIRDTYGVSIATTIRACTLGRPIKSGTFAGWVLSYAPAPVAPTIPEEYQHLPRTRQDAKAVGATQYYTGLPCERGHLSLRATKGTCIACRREDGATIRVGRLNMLAAKKKP